VAEVTLMIGGRGHVVACRDGEEAHLLQLGATLDRHFQVAHTASGGQSGERTFLYLSLILADALDEAHRQPSADRDNATLNRVAERLEAVASALEDAG
jgi:cell division protein ZapA